MCISCPTILFPLRTIRRNTMQVTSISLHGRIPDLVQRFIRTTKRTHRFQVGMQEKRRQTLFRQLHRLITFHFYILETVISKRRHENFLFACSFQIIFIHLEYLARLHRMIIHVDISLFQSSVFLQQLAMLQRDVRTGFPFHFQTAQTGYILRKRIDIQSVTECFH